MFEPIGKLLGEWSTELNVWSAVLRVALSMALAAIIGCERSSKRHSAGLRTFIVVSLGMTLAMLTDMYVYGLTGKSYFLISAAAVVAIATITVNSILFSSKNQIKVSIYICITIWEVVSLPFDLNVFPRTLKYCALFSFTYT